MVDLTTTNYGFTKPTVGADIGTWGPIANTNFDLIDTDLKAVSDVANAALPLAGGTMTGALVGLNARFNCTTGGAVPYVKFSRGGSTRWTLSVDTSTETGANAASNMTLAALADDGVTTIFTPVTIARSTGLITFGAGAAVTGNLAVSGTITGTYVIPANTVTPAMMTTGHPSWDATGNLTASGGSAGALATTTTNTSTGAGVIARYALTTGTANSSVNLQLNDVSGAPTGQLVVGSAVASFAYDADTQLWRTRAGVERMRLSSSGFLGIGTATPLRLLHVAGANTAEASYTATNGLANFKTWNVLVDGTAGIKASWSLRLLTDDQVTTQWTAITVSGTTGVVNFPQGLTSNGVAVALTSDGRLTGLPINVVNTSLYTVQSTDWGGCVHVQTNSTITIPAGITVGVCFEISCDPGVTVNFTYAGTARTVPANSTAAHTMVGPGSAFVEQKKVTEIWLRGDAT